MSAPVQLLLLYYAYTNYLLVVFWLLPVLHWVVVDDEFLINSRQTMEEVLAAGSQFHS